MSSAGGNALLWLIGTLALLVVALVVGVLWMTAVPGRSHAGSLPPLKPEQVELNHVSFEKRSFSSSGWRQSLPQRRSASAHGSWLIRASKPAARRVRSSALAWQ